MTPDLNLTCPPSNETSAEILPTNKRSSYIKGSEFNTFAFATFYKYIFFALMVYIAVELFYSFDNFFGLNFTIFLYIKT